MTDATNHREHDAVHILHQLGQTWQTHLRPVLEEALRNLPEQEELILRLSFYQQLSDSEIATQLDLPGGANAVPSRQAQALRMLTNAGWARDVTPDDVEVLLEQAGEGWRLAVAPPLQGEARAQADRAMARALKRVSASSGPSHQTLAGSQAPDRSAHRPLGRLRLVGARRYLPIAAVVLVGLYGTLWLAGRAARPDTFALASVEAYEETLQERVRSEGDETPDAFTEGAAALLAARQHTWGLFPRYSTPLVERAIEHLERAFETAQDPFLQARAGFFLAKAHLMKGDVDAARMWLGQVLDLETAAYRDDAQSLLQALGTP